MEDRLVSDQSSSYKGSGGEHRSAPLSAYTPKFYDLFPYYLSIGMTYEQYWEQDCQLVKYYRKAAQIRQDLRNQDAWLQGAYFYEALIDAAPVLRAFAKKGTKPVPYRESPYELFNRQDKKQQKQLQEKHDDRAKAYMEAFMVSVNKKFQEKGGDVNGGQCGNAGS